MKSIAQRIAEELNVRLPQVDAGDRAARRQGHRAVHRPLSQGSHRRSRRHAAAHARRAADLSARARGAARRDPQEHRGAGQADAGAGGVDPAAPTPRRGSRISICRTSRSGGRRRRLRAKRGSSRWRSRCCSDPTLVPEEAAAASSTPTRASPMRGAALEGARWILMETFAEDAELVGGLRQLLWERGEWKSTVVAGKEEEGAKFSDYFSASEPREERAVAPRAGAAARPQRGHPPPGGGAAGTERRRRARPSRSGALRRAPASRTGAAPADAWLAETVRWTWKVKMLGAPRARHRAAAARSRPRPKRSACSAATCTTCCSRRRPASASRWGSIPGIRTGVKVAVVDGTGKLLDTATDLSARAAKRLGRLAADARPRCARGTACS